MEASQLEPVSHNVDKDRLESVAAAFRAGEHIYRNLGSPLYGVLCAEAGEDPDLVALASNTQDRAGPIHLLACVHALLLRDPDDPLSRYYATLTDEPASPEDAFADFARYCKKHRDEIVHLLKTRTVQTTYVERCGPLMPALSLVADMAGEPLNLVEIGCSAGVLLTFDKYAYAIKGRDPIGAADAPITLTPEIEGRPPLRLPEIGTRTGLDLHLIDAKREEDRRWILALSFPELRGQQARLAKALDVIAATDIRLYEGDALDLLPRVLAETPSPLCVFHSACVFYWSAEAKAALDALLREAGRERDIYRVGIEPPDRFNAWRQTNADTREQPETIARRAGCEITVSRYHDGTVDARIVAHATPDFGHVDWIEEKQNLSTMGESGE